MSNGSCYQDQLLVIVPVEVVNHGVLGGHGCLRLETRFIIGIFGNRNKNNDKDLIMSDVCSKVVGTLLCVANGHIIY